MFGSVSEWFYKVLGGINPAPDAVGFDKIVIRPRPAGDLKWVKASYESAHGKIVSEWTWEAGKFHLRVRIPVGAEARVFLPAREGTRVTESGSPIERALGVQLVRRDQGSVEVAVGSGDYEFRSER